MVLLLWIALATGCQIEGDTLFDFSSAPQLEGKSNKERKMAKTEEEEKK